MFVRQVDPGIELRLVEQKEALELFQLIEQNRGYLREWLPWVDKTRSADDIRHFIQRAHGQFAANQGPTALIRVDGKVSGVIGCHPIDWANRHCSIGYWLTAGLQRKGVMTRWTTSSMAALCTASPSNAPPATTAVAPSPNASVSPAKASCANPSGSMTAFWIWSSGACWSTIGEHAAAAARYNRNMRDWGTFFLRLGLAALLLCALLAAAPMTKLNIVVKTRGGKPVERASVVVRFIEGHSVVKLGKAIRTTFELRTNQEGEAKVPSIPQGKIRVQVIAKGYQTFGQEFDVTDEEKQLDITLNPPQQQYTAH
jgi:hypothetical protein